MLPLGLLWPDFVLLKLQYDDLHHARSVWCSNIPGPKLKNDSPFPEFFPVSVHILSLYLMFIDNVYFYGVRVLAWCPTHHSGGPDLTLGFPCLGDLLLYALRFPSPSLWDTLCLLPLVRPVWSGWSCQYLHYQFHSLTFVGVCKCHC